jgi:5'-nucleotidase
MNTSKYRSIMPSLLVIAVLVFATSFAASGPKETVNVQVLAVNDFHGALETTSNFGGVAYLATYVQNLRATNPNTIFVSGGDLIGASPLLSALFHDEPTINAFNLMGLDYSAVGNHEFDEGVQELQRMQEGGCNPIDGCQAGDFLGADFKFLASNVILTKNGHTLFSAYKVRSFMGAKVAFIGVSLDSTPSIVTAAGTAGVTFEDEATVINATVGELKQDGIKAFVVIVHDGLNVCGTNPNPNNLVNATDPEIDVFITGHSHSTYACKYNGRTVSQAGSSGAYLTDVNLTLDRETGQVTASTVQNIHVDKRLVAPDPDETALLAIYKAIADPLANRVIGSITADITTSGTESALGDVIADTQLWATSSPATGGAVVAFMNPGGIRASLLYNQISGGEQPGEVTYGEAFTVQPFSDNLVVMTMTGAQLKSLLEQEWGGGCAKLQISNGFTYTVTQSAPQGSRISNIKINGVDVIPTANYQIEANNFLAGGGDGCTVFVQATNQIYEGMDLDAFVAYFQAHSPVAPGPKNRITILP